MRFIQVREDLKRDGVPQNVSNVQTGEQQHYNNTELRPQIHFSAVKIENRAREEGVNRKAEYGKNDPAKYLITPRGEHKWNVAA